MIGRTLKWIGVGAALWAVAAFSLLVVIGIPEPPAIETDDVGRVSWMPVINNLTWFDKLRSKSVVALLPEGSGALVRASRHGLDTRVHLLEGPGRKLQFLPQFPSQATAFHVAPGRDYVLTQWDEGGNELFRLYRWDLGDTPPVPITGSGERSHFGAFEPNGTRIAYTSNRRNGTDFDVYTVDPLNPATDHLLAELEGSWSVADWSPDSDQLLLVHAESNREHRLYMVDVETGSRALVMESEAGALHVSPQWSRDGRALYYASNRGSEFAHLRRLDIATGEEHVLSASVPWDVSSVQQSPDGTVLLVAFNEDGRTRYYMTDRDATTFEPFRPLTGIFAAGFHPDEPAIIVNHTDSRGVARGYVYDLDSGDLDLWVGTEPAESDLPIPELIRFPTFDVVADGERRLIPAFVYPGTGPGPHPVTISVHGGPEAQASLSTAWGVAQRQGVTVITPNVRGSTGYGRSYEQLDNGVLREDAVRDIGALLDWIADNPELDADRVAIVGGSYGGYMVLASLVHFPDRIRCGIDRVGVSNFVTFLENTADWRRDLRRAEYGDERDPAMREFLQDISPLTHADRITARLMVIQGANDPRVPVTESRQLVEKVSANGQQVSYIEAADEGHGFKKPWNSFYTYFAEQQMLGECLEL